ncbi:helix-turn-helix domain-containing protein [Plesiomonas shigelloides]|uniref:Phage regulatory protein n=1 Tax=Plesiomonas shigelloides 302-73 TaxID=1315976 RepID=R8ANB2_PLESH|nr:helix-turn-helix domain-containing protein [Plesiomonas shigelloides]EON87839.1 phage regulatory protein [Plesiomonas shigelloides 302-73]
MTAQISIRIPSALVSPSEFARLEGISRNTVYAWCCRGTLAKYMQPKTNGRARTKIYYAKYKLNQMTEALGHSRFEIIIGD